ncbi:MFS transporter [Fundicoccus sp. Sow4_H7]|uniref:MFS transporter n=1 Tax=Fundicoccus sp. Sow4_H7 TaxID=3438784 RepID=UPI003F937594
MKRININYGGMMGSYDVVVGSISAYSSVFLLAQGLDDFMIGLITSTANLIASFIQPWLADKVDKSIKLNLWHVNLMIVIPSLLLLVGVLLANRIVTLVAVFYMLLLMFQVTLLPFLSAIGVYLMNNHFKINYGAFRAFQSASFAVTSTGLGILVNKLGTQAVIYVAILGYLIYLTLLTILYQTVLKSLFAQRSQDIKLNPLDVALQPAKEPFFNKYPHFKYIVFGSFCFFIGHNFINLFMIQIVEKLGGTTENMGFAMGLSAIAEVPILIMFSRINRRFSINQLMMTAAIFFAIKTTLTFLTPSILGIYGAQLLQPFAFGIYIVASVYYTNSQMEATDKVKGQSLITTAHTLGAVAGSFIGGWLINTYTVQHGLFFCIVMSILGVCSYYLGLFQTIK